MGLFNCFSSRPKFLLFVSLILIFSSFFTFFLVPIVIKSSIVKSLPLINSTSSRTFDKWESVPISIITKFYLFNITNPEEVEKHGRLPIVQELGPYTFSESRKKINISWSDDLNQVEYGQQRTWHFLPHLTNGSLEDNIYHLNVPMVAAGYSIKSWGGSRIAYFGLNQIIKATKSRLIPSHTVGQLLFEGYDDPLITFSRTIGMPVPYDKFGWFYGRNGTVSDGTFGVYTGFSNFNHLDAMYSWNNQTSLSLWWGDKCNSLSGVSASDFQPPLQEGPFSSIKIFVGDICRSLELPFDKTVIKHGVKAYRYAANSNLFNYTVKNNRCYCNNNACPPDGVADISPCQHGSPAAASLPHFLFGDASLYERVHGLHPDLDRHEFFMDIEPTLGIPTKVKVAMQINVLLERDDNLEYARSLPFESSYYPMIWFSAGAELDESMASQVRLLQSLGLILNVSAAIQASIAIIVLMITIIFYRSQLFSTKKHHLVPTEDSDDS